MKSVKYIGVCLALFFANSTWAQNQDFGFWTAFKVSQKLNKKWSAFGELQSRFKNNGSDLDNAFVQGGVSYKIAKWYELGAVYRYSNNGEMDAHRFDVNNTFKYKIDQKNALSFRLKFTKSYVTHKIKGERFRVRLKYQFKVNKKFIPYVKAQYFYTRVYDFSKWNLQRYSIGSEVRIAKKNFIDVFFTYQFEYNVFNPLTEYIFGLKYKLKYK